MSATDGSPTKTGWKRRSSAASFSMCLRYSSSVVAPIARSSPRASIGFSMFAASTAPSAAPAPTIVCSSSMKRMISPSAFWISVSTAFSRSSNSPRYFEPASSAPMSSAQTRLPFRPSGTSPATIRCARPSTIAVLPTPGSPISTGLFFVRRESTWITRRISSSRPITGSSLPALGELGQVAAELLERLVGALGILRGDALAAAHLLELREQLVARDDVEREQQVLGRDVLVLELARLVARRGRAPARTRRETRGCCGAPSIDGLLRERRLGLRRAASAGVGDERARQLLVEQREQQVLGVELGVAAAARAAPARRRPPPAT